MSKTTPNSQSTLAPAQAHEAKSNSIADDKCNTHDLQPNSKNNKLRKNRSKLGKAMRYSAIALSVSAVFVLGGAFVCAPDMSKYEQRSETLYDREGNIIYTSLSDGDYLRIKTDAQDVDPLYIKMLLSSEDERFYLHPGVDPLSATRALVSNVSSLKRVSGASTLAMQVCRMLEPKERTIFSKVREALGALYITAAYGRDEILNMYLTLAPFGGNIEGVTAASYSYFNHGPQHLTPAEAALLVALPRSPESMRPDRRPKVAKYYRNEVLKKAVADGLIKADILATATEEQLPGLRYKLPQNGYYLGQSLFKGTLRTPDLIDQVSSKEVLAESQSYDGMDIALPREMVSSIDPEIQQALLDAVEVHAKMYVNAQEQDNIAIVAVDNKTFEVKGYVGGVGTAYSFVDAAQSIRSPGSALKPFVYGMAFEQGLLHPNTVLLDSAKLYRTYQPRNFDRLFFGEVTAYLALQASLNLPALDLMTAIGPVNFIRRFNALKNTLPFERGRVYPPLKHGESSILLSPQEQSAFMQTLTDTNGNKQSLSSNNSSNLAAVKSQDLKDLPSAKQSDEEQLLAILKARRNSSYPQGRLVLPNYAAPDISIALGGTGISLFDLTQMYAALANDGMIKPLRITPVKNTQLGNKDHGKLLRDKDHESEHGQEGSSASISGDHAVVSSAKDDFVVGEAKMMENDAARAVYKILEGSLEPLGFYNEHIKVSYKTGTSFKSRDAWAVGSHNNITVGVWVGRNNGRPTNGYTGYSVAAPVLFNIFNTIETMPRSDLGELHSVLLQPTPPVALSSIEIKDIGRVQKRRGDTLKQEKSLANRHAPDGLARSATASNSLGSPSKAANNTNDLRLVFPIDGSRMNVGFSKRIMIQFNGGVGPYYVLINDEVHDKLDYFEPQKDGFYNITVIDSKGKSVSSQVFIQGIDKNPAPAHDSNQD